MIADYARAAAARGWHIFPLRPGSKIPPPNLTDWEQRASTEAAKITTAWGRSPEPNIGLACGPSGLVVIDLDTPKRGEPGTGRDTFAALAERAGQGWPSTYTVATPSGGQ